MAATRSASRFSFDFDYEEAVEEQEVANPVGATSATSYFGFEVDVPLDSEGDLIFPDETLDEKTIQSGLSKVYPVISSFKHAFTKFQARNKRISEIEMLSQYIHLRNVDLGYNRLSDIAALVPLTYLQVLNLESNNISDVAVFAKFIYLQALNLAKNDISITEGFQPNKLAYLSLTKNRVTRLTGFKSDIFPNLLVLELRDNQLTTLRGIDLPKLENLYVAENELTDLAGLNKCHNLKFIHARRNAIDRLNNFGTFDKLEYINLRDNKIERYTQLFKLGKSKALKTVIVSDNPISPDERYRLEVIAACPPSVRRLDKYLISQLEQVNGLMLRNSRERHGVTSSNELSNSFDSYGPTDSSYEGPDYYDYGEPQQYNPDNDTDAGLSEWQNEDE